MSHDVRILGTARAWATLTLVCCLSQANGAEAIVSAGWGHNLAVSTDGKVYTWGSDNSGQLGVGRQSKAVRPQAVPTTQLGVNPREEQLAAGTYHSAVVKSDGSVWTWGDNLLGQLGDGSLTARAESAKVNGLPGAATAVSAGYSHTLVLLNNGTLWSWGGNARGSLGMGTTDPLSTVPVAVQGLQGVTVERIAAGFEHNLAISEGWVLCWGSNSYGQLGTGDTVTWYSPTLVFGLPYVTQVSAGVYHSLALDEHGVVWAWGFNGGGRLGDGTTQDSLEPKEVSGLPVVTAIAAGGQHSLALDTDGNVWAWGGNGDGQLGDGTRVDRSIPVKIAGLPRIVRIAARNDHNLAIDASGNVWAWGLGTSGQLGDATATSHSQPTRINTLTSTSMVATGYTHSLAVGSDGRLWGWGENLSGQLGLSAATDRTFPALVSGTGTVVSASAGFRHSLVATSTGEVWGWGYNLGGQLGDGTIESKTAPVRTEGLDQVVQVSAGLLHSLARRSDGSVWSWGANASGQAGRGAYSQREAPRAVSGLNDVQHIAAGYSFNLAVTRDGKVWAWGNNDLGQLGDGTTQTRLTPIPVPGVAKVRMVAASSGHSLALTTDGHVWAWGEQSEGKLGNGQIQAGIGTPAQVPGLSGVVAIAAGPAYSMAVRNDGSVWAWGFLLDSGTGTSAPEPRQLTELSDITAVTSGTLHLAALRKDGIVLTRGMNVEGGLGDGTYSLHFDAAGVVNERIDALLDLAPAVTNLPLATGKTPVFFVASQKTGSKRNLSLTADVRGLAASVSTAGDMRARAAGTRYNVYVAASVPAGNQVQLFQLDGVRGWGPLGWPMSEYLRDVALNDQDTVVRAQILENIDLSTLAGAQIYMGFGTDPNEMVEKGRIRVLYTVPKD